MLTREELNVASLGEPRYDSVLNLSTTEGDGLPDYVPDETRVPLRVSIQPGFESEKDLTFERAGARARLFFDPAKCYAAIVTCGGLCPGLNNVIQSVYSELHYRYGIRKVLGVRYGFQGFDSDRGLEPVEMTPAFVEPIHNFGGSVLGSSRGHVAPELIVETLERWKIDMLFVIGGDGTLRGAHAIAGEALRRGLKISVIGIPKTIDNDILYVYKTFGFDTAVQEACKVLHCAHNEARGAPNCIGLVKVMGRDSGFIASYATLAGNVVNFTLIPEVPFKLEGEGGLLTLLAERIKGRGHAVVVVAEGAGLEHISEGEISYDASGNIQYSQMTKDVGIFLRDKMKSYFEAQKIPATIKYIDPSYIIRSVQAGASDALFCNDLGRAAVHAAMAGKTDMVVGLWYNVLTHVPLAAVVSGKKKVDPASQLWLAVTESTGQPLRFLTEDKAKGSS
ncbi:MAG: ATP-dependent 6-phosphofructokinase [Candidatus Glassbacteria bacterium]|nr:ATP-dependent 6-phosphofructokinase [Candidatus Glassbacteria bacterium]